MSSVVVIHRLQYLRCACCGIFSINSSLITSIDYNIQVVGHLRCVCCGRHPSTTIIFAVSAVASFQYLITNFWNVLQQYNDTVIHHHHQECRRGIRSRNAVLLDVIRVIPESLHLSLPSTCYLSTFSDVQSRPRLGIGLFPDG